MVTPIGTCSPPELISDAVAAADADRFYDAMQPPEQKLGSKSASLHGVYLTAGRRLRFVPLSLGSDHGNPLRPTENTRNNRRA